MSVWSPMQYGWGVVYWLTIEGVPVVFIERATTLALPSGYAQDASLVIDRSSEVGQQVDRETGLGAGFPLTVQLLDTTTVRAWLRRWTNQAQLAADVAWNDATITVDDNTSWPASGAFWIGQERVTYTGKAAGPARFTGCTRGTAGSLASQHYAGTLGALLTDLPRWWRGRQVRLFASPVTPSGTMTGATLVDEADEIWRGVIDQGPDRVGGLWEIQAQALDRRIDLPLAARITGKVIDQQARYPVQPSYVVAVRIAGWNGAGPPVKLWDFEVLLEPFASYSSGALLTAAEQIDAIRAAWVAALPLAPNLVSGLFDAATYLAEIVATHNGVSWGWSVSLQAGAVPVNGSIGNRVSWNYGAPGPLYLEHQWWGVVANQKHALQWRSAGDQVKGAFVPGAPMVPPASGVAVELDAPIAALPTWGKLLVDGAEVVFTSSAQAGNLAFFAGFYGNASKAVNTAPLVPGATVEVVVTVAGDSDDVMRRLLSSSGTGQRGTYDTLDWGQGYGLDGSTADTSAVNNASFDALVAGPMVAVPVDVSLAGRTFAEVFGGLLALSQRGVVVRGDDLLGARRQRLALVSTEPGGGAWETLITDEHVLTTRGEPVVAVRKRDVPNTVKITAPQDSDDPDVFTVADWSAIVGQGVVDVDYSLPTSSKLVAEQVAQWALARFAPAQTEQLIEVRLVPWLDLDVGDCVRLELTHHAIWTWSSGTPGYTGTGRVLGVKRDLAGAAVTAAILIDGTTRKLALCPSMEVTAWTGPAAAPLTITVARRFYAHLAKTIEQAGGAVWLRHYEPGLGAEAGGGLYSIGAATDTGTACQLAVVGMFGAPVLSASSWLTLPETAQATDYQDGFAHGGDGSTWG